MNGELKRKLLAVVPALLPQHSYMRIMKKGLIA